MRNKIGVYVCQCGSNISDYVDVEKVKEIASQQKGVTVTKITMFACADSAQKEMVEDIKKNNLDAIVIASCSPKLHVPTFRGVAERAGLNPYNYVQVNIREQVSWAHSDNPEQATEKAIRSVNAGIARVSHSEPLETIKISALNTVTVIGAGVSGMRSAVELADMGTFVHLIEREHFVGGRVSQWGDLFTTHESGEEVVTRLFKEVMKHDNIKLYTGAELMSYTGSVGDMKLQVRLTPRYVKEKCNIENLDKAIEVCPVEVPDEFNFFLTKRKAIYKNFESEFPKMPAIDTKYCTFCGDCQKVCPDIDLEQKEQIIDFSSGAILLNSGFDPYEPKEGEYGYKTIDNVVTLQQFKRLIELNDDKLKFNEKVIKSVAFIYCVGSRQVNGDNKFCSRYCCTSAIHTAINIKEKYGDIQNYHVNRGIRTYGKQELLYEQSSNQGDIYLQFYDESDAVVEKDGDKTVVRVEDFLTAGKTIDIYPNLVVLVTGMERRKDTSIGNTLKVPVGRDRFYNEIHPKLRPVETVIDGIFIAGACQGPKNITEAMKSSLSAAAKANSLLTKGEIELEPTLATVNPNACEWCDKCLAACPY
ncbi:MAG: CoB--CoM heterodisulfide reductase iron-sulfur subunit A family protein, partial [Bacteroidales bacterium]|nr:CoB--CoM heterodisulfide reductase iron-sulfur subunit A family protein [Bacteroidales bacterium]